MTYDVLLTEQVHSSSIGCPSKGLERPSRHYGHVSANRFLDNETTKHRQPGRDGRQPSGWQQYPVGQGRAWPAPMCSSRRSGNSLLHCNRELSAHTAGVWAKMSCRDQLEVQLGQVQLQVDLRLHHESEQPVRVKLMLVQCPQVQFRVLFLCALPVAPRLRLGVLTTHLDYVMSAQVLHAIALAAVDRPGWHSTHWYRARYPKSPGRD
jgi:hypothetical protein